MSVNRLVKLEAENVALQEEVLMLKKKLTAANLSSSPVKSAGVIDTTDLENVISSLREGIFRAVDELAKYRARDPTVDDVRSWTIEPSKKSVEKKSENIFDLDELLK